MGNTSPKPNVPDLSALRIADHKRKGRPITKWIGIILLAGLFVAGGLREWSVLANHRPEVEVFAAIAPSSAPVSALLNASGYVTPRNRASVAAKITGKVVTVYVDEGMRVGKGQVLAQLDDSDYRVSLASTKAERDAVLASIPDLEVQLGNAQREQERTKRLTDAGVQTPQALDTAQTLVNRLRAQIASAKSQVQAADAKIGIDQQNIDNCKVLSPFDGIVVSKDAQPGEMISPISAGGGFTRTGIATVVDMASNEIEVDVNENYIARVKPKQKVTATLDAYPDWQIPCFVRTVIPTADRVKGTVKVRITFEHLDPRILPDMGVKVAFLGDEPTKQKEGAISPVALIPPQAIHTANGQSAVFLFHDGNVERRAIRAGAARGANVEVFEGIAPGDLVIVKGPDNLQDGQRVDRKQ
jgi:RND family efflux transporter MFP subunit